MQKKDQQDVEKRIASVFNDIIQQSMQSLRTEITQQTVQSAQNLHTTMDAANNSNLNEQNKLNQNMTQLITNMQSDNAKHVEAGIGVFGNSLRAQLDTMQQAQASQRMEAETNISTKMDGLLG